LNISASGKPRNPDADGAALFMQANERPILLGRFMLPAAGEVLFKEQEH
jgi:hypothetical protein